MDAHLHAPPDAFRNRSGSDSKRRSSVIVPHKRYSVSLSKSGMEELYKSMTGQMDRQALMLAMNALILIAALLLVWFIFDLRKDFLEQARAAKAAAEE